MENSIVSYHHLNQIKQHGFLSMVISHKPSVSILENMQNQQGGGSPFQDSNVIDGEAREVKPDQKQIEHKDQK